MVSSKHGLTCFLASQSSTFESPRTALAQFQRSIGYEINAKDCVVKYKITNGLFSIKKVAFASDADTKEALVSLSHVGKRALAELPEGYMIVHLGIESDGKGKQDAPKEASILLDLLKQGTVHVKLQQGAEGLKVIGTLVGISQSESAGDQEGLTWFLAKVKGIQSGI